MVVREINSKIRDCFGKSDRNFIATNNGNVSSGYATGKTEQEAIDNLVIDNTKTTVKKECPANCLGYNGACNRNIYSLNCNKIF
jgi:hypothetical protein